MKRLALAATLAATAFAAPAFADGHNAGVTVMHFNMSADNASELVMTPGSDAPMSMALTPGSTLADVFAQLNMDADVAMDVNGANGVTVIMTGNSEAAAAIFARLMAADDDN